ncbi:MAG: hypothetical protein N2316_05625 [Spirochaetes bacterium]|nr:hypothetical protein [Spirochaetota bacterium]
MKRSVFFGCLGLCIVWCVTISQAAINEDNFYESEQKALQSFRRGDYFALYEAIEEIVRSRFENPRAFLYVYDIARLGDVVGRKKAIHALERVTKQVEKSNNAARSAAKLVLTLEMEKLLKLENPQKSKELIKSLYPVTTWLLIGPYWKYGPGDLYAPFPPETIETLSESNIKIRRVKIAEDGLLQVKRFLYPASGIAYAAFSFRHSDEVKLRIFSDERYVLFVNGKQILVNDENNAKRRVRIVRLWGCSEFSVMIKIQKRSSWALRVILTDSSDNPIRIPIELDRLYRADFRYAEEMEYPFAQLMAIEEGTTKELALAYFFDELESEESLAFYKAVAQKQKTPFAKYLYAAALLAYGGDDVNSARNLEGRRLMKEVTEEDSLMVPALHKKFRAIYESKDMMGAARFGRDVAGISRYYFPFRRDYVRLLRFLNYNKEFEEEIEKFKRDFPDAIVPLKEEAAYYRYINPLKASQLDSLILEKEYSKKHLSELIKYHSRKGDLKQAHALVEKYGEEAGLWRDRASVLIDLRKFEEAKEIIYKRLLEREEPDCYRMLGFLDALSGDDPLMQWKRELEIRPSNFALEEYVNYLEKNSIYPLCKEAEEKTKSFLEAWKRGEFARMPSTVLYRARVYELMKDGGSRAYCEDIVILNDQKAIAQWGEYSVVHRGTFKPVRIRVYHPDGEYTDAYSMQDVDGENYINLPSLKENSFVHISYYVENPIREPLYANLFALPPTEICSFEEPVKEFFFSVSFPKDIQCNVIMPEGAEQFEREMDSIVQYSFVMKEIPGIVRERFGGNRLNMLPFYAFSTLRDESDFARWYRGLLVGVFDIDQKMCAEQFRGRGLNLIENVYEFVARNVELEQRNLYYPQKASDVFYMRRGGAEGKVILAKAILERFGILSFIAFARRADRPALSNFISPHVFTDVLLCIPLSDTNVLWLDFSSMEYSCGDVNPLLEGVEAFVLVGNEIECKRIFGKQSARAKGYFRIRIDENAQTFLEGKVELFGTKAAFRRNLIDEREKEKAVQKYFGYMIPSFNMDDYAILNATEYSKPLVLSASGYFHGIANHIGNGIVLKISPLQSEVLEYVLYSQRVHPLFIGESISEEDVYEYVLDPKAKVNTIPPAFAYECPFGKFEINAKYNSNEHSITVRKRVFVRSGYILQKQYKDFINFCDAIKEAENAHVLLSVTAE